MIALRHLARVVGIATAVAIAVVMPASADDWGHKLGVLPTDFIFGYGSLIERGSREATVGHHTDALPARISAGFGYLRAWVDRCTCGFTALGLRLPGPGEAAMTINGVIYPVDAADMTAYDARESNYRRVAVPPGMVEAVSWQRLPEQGTIWVYVPIGPDGQLGTGLPTPSPAFPLVESYVDLVVRGGLEYGPEFAREIIATTGDWSRFWLNDREQPRRPWVHTADYRNIDRLLGETEPAKDYLSDRLFPETFTARWLLQQPPPP
jgi:hypothetical protein